LPVFSFARHAQPIEQTNRAASRVLTLAPAFITLETTAKAISFTPRKIDT
jgi:hypothetical protein